jgi:hypothetical protein
MFKGRTVYAQTNIYEVIINIIAYAIEFTVEFMITLTVEIIEILLMVLDSVLLRIYLDIIFTIDIYFKKYGVTIVLELCCMMIIAWEKCTNIIITLILIVLDICFMPINLCLRIQNNFDAFFIYSMPEYGAEIARTLREFNSNIELK